MSLENADLVVSYGYGAPREHDAIQAHGENLALAIADLTGLRTAVASLDRTVTSCIEHGAKPMVLLQYNPYSYGRRGLSLSVARDVQRLTRRSEARLTVIVHEPWIPLQFGPALAIGLVQRAQTWAICRSAERVLTTTGRYRRRLARLPAMSQPVTRVAVGSNLPDRRDRRTSVRRSLGLTDSDLVVAQVGSRHPSWLVNHVRVALHALGERVHGLTCLNLGATAPPIQAAGVRVVSPGSLSDDALAEHLASADLFLAPFIDGVSTRRTSVAAALQHALPVVTTEIPETDDVLRSSGGLRLAPVADDAAFARCAVELAADASLRRNQAAAARLLFESEFSWPVIASRVANAIPLR